MANELQTSIFGLFVKSLSIFGMTNHHYGTDLNYRVIITQWANAHFLRKCKELIGDVDADRPNISTCIAHRPRSVFMSVYVPCVWSEISTKFQLTCLYVCNVGEFSGHRHNIARRLLSSSWLPSGHNLDPLCTYLDVHMHWKCNEHAFPPMEPVFQGFSDPMTVTSSCDFVFPCCLPLVVDQCPHFGTSGNLMCIYNWTPFSLAEPVWMSISHNLEPLRTWCAYAMQQRFC